MKETEAVMKKTSFYWGPLSVEEAHTKLQDTPMGTFLIRDSSHPTCLFALSYSASPCPMSTRIKVEEMGLSLESEPEHRFPNLCSLLKHYQNEGSITTPHQRKELCLKESNYVNMQEESDYVNMQVHKQYILIKETEADVKKTSFYWGPLSVEEAHTKLLATPLGTFLIRDSSHPTYLFALSYSASPSPRSKRIKVEEMGLSFESEPEHRFPNLCALLKHYKNAGSITTPHQRKEESNYVNMQLSNLGMC